MSKDEMMLRRRPSLTVEDTCRINGALYLAKLSVGGSELDELIDRFSALVRETVDPKFRETVDSYRAAVEERDGELEMDNDAEVSLGDDPGAYVMVWKWVSEEEAGLGPKEIICNRCGDRIDTRDNVFLLFINRNGSEEREPISPQRVVDAIEKHKARWGNRKPYTPRSILNKSEN